METPDGGYVATADFDADGIDDEVSLTKDELAAASPEIAVLLDADLADLEDGGVGDPLADPTQDPAPILPEDQPETHLTPLQDPATVGPEFETNYEGEGFQVQEGVLVGDPAGDAEHWFNQAQNGFCVPSSVAQIVSEYSGEHFANEEAFVERANELGLFVVGMDGVPGMTQAGALELLESCGVEAAPLENGSLDKLENFLEEGRRTMLFVDSGEIWEGEAVEDNAMDHAVVVTGIDVDAGVVILSDPGTPDGNMLEVPIDTFMDAWADGGYSGVVADAPPPGHVAAPVETETEAEVQPVGFPAGLDPVQAPRAEVGFDGVRDQIADVARWVTSHAWALLPITIAVGAGLSRR